MDASKTTRFNVDANKMERVQFITVAVTALLFILMAFVYDSPSAIWSGFIRIQISPSNLVTDYFALANVGSTFLNVGFMTLISLVLVKFTGAKMTGVVVAALFTVAGFAFFGKNLINSIPITFGVYLAAKFKRVPFKNYIGPALFGSAMGPLVSELAFDQHLSIPMGLLVGGLAGIVLGFILTPLADSFRNFHLGFNLYNIGFTAGIITMCFKGILEAFGVEIHLVSLESSGHNIQMALFLVLFFAALFILGCLLDGLPLPNYKRLLKHTGQGAEDFIEATTFGTTLINMAVLGYVTTLYVLILGGELNGPALGGIFTVVGFGAAGKHIKNVTPIMIGVIIAVLLDRDHTLSTTSSVLVALFGTCLAPIAGKYGFVAGIIAGFFHMALATNISIMHGGMNLYNNGFAGGFIAAFMVPVLDFIFDRVDWLNTKSAP